MERYVIHVTKECNMNCLYCYEDDKDSTYTWNEVKLLIDNIIKHNKEKEFSIEYLGGEPLLAFDIIKKATNYLEANNSINIPSYVITTNGTILNDEIIDFLMESEKVKWYASMDGTKEMNQFRTFKDTEKNSHDTVLENHKKLADMIGTDRVGIHMVTHPYNIGYLADGIDHLYRNGVRGIGVGTVEKTMTLTDEYIDTFKSEFKIISEHIAKGLYSDLSIDLLSYIKPRSDVRNYVRDEYGKVIAESYGRTENDITKSNVYNSYQGHSPIGSAIQDIREYVYYQHQNIINKYRDENNDNR